MISRVAINHSKQAISVAVAPFKTKVDEDSKA